MQLNQEVISLQRFSIFSIHVQVLTRWNKMPRTWRRRAFLIE